MAAGAAGPAMATFAAFLAFHRELAAARRLVETEGHVPSSFAEEAPFSSPSPGGDAEAGVVGTALVAVPARAGHDGRDLRFEVFAQLRGAITGGGAIGGGGVLGDARADPRYVMAAVADETMLHFADWPGRAWWADNLLEEALFQSRLCGEEIFRIGRDIVEGRLHGRADLAMAILLALSLGFRGRYRGMDDGGVIEDLRRRLYDVIFHRPPPRGIDWQAVMPNAATLTLPPGGPWRRTRIAMRLWLLALVGVGLGYLGLSHAIWHYHSAGLLEHAAAIAAHVQRVAAP